MAYTTPSIEPTQARVGETWTWKKTLADFPANVWTLSYTLFNSSGVVSITASADGTDHLVDVAPATTAGYAVGRYDWIAQIDDGTDVHQVGKGAIQVLPDVASASSYDGRSHARKMLDAINAILEGRATNSDIDVVQTAVGGRSITNDLEQLLKLKQQYAAAVKAEDDAIALANGQTTGRFIQTRFVA